MNMSKQIVGAPFWPFRRLLRHMVNVHYAHYPLMYDDDEKPLSTIILGRRLNPRYIVANLFSVFLLLDLLIIVLDNNFVLGEDPRVFYRVITRIWPSTLNQRDTLTFVCYFFIPWTYYYYMFDQYPHVSTMMVIERSTDIVRVEGKRESCYLISYQFF